MPPGGDYYDRPTYSSSSSGSSGGGGSGYSKQSDQLLSQNRKLAKVLDPKQFVEDKMTTDSKNPVIFALDISGSMSNWPKIVYDKLPMFYGQIMLQKYLDDPAISFCAFNDCYNTTGIQVADFGRGLEIDQMISKMWLEGGGGGPNDPGTSCELYELVIWFYLNLMDLSVIEKADCPCFFFTGDESYRLKVIKEEIMKRTGINMDLEENKRKYSDEFDTLKLIEKLKKLFKGNVFILKKPIDNHWDPKINPRWDKALGKEFVLHFSNPKACMDVALGAIALASGTRSLEDYMNDMKEKGQEEERCRMVKQALLPLSVVMKDRKKGGDEVEDFE